MEKYDLIGNSYNQSRSADPHLADKLLQLLGLAPGRRCLDIGCGTGNYTGALARQGLQMVGVDPSERMLRQALDHYPQIEWHKGTAEAIPLPDASVDGIAGSLTLHHWQDIPGGFRELHRVARPGATLVFFSAAPEQMRHYWLSHYFPTMIQSSIDQMPDLEHIRKAAEDAGFAYLGEEIYHVRPDLRDLFLYAGKDRPHLYLDPNMRRGISSFADLALREEVDSGLEALESDLNSNQWEEIREQYRHEGGDYLWIRASKPN